MLPPAWLTRVLFGAAGPAVELKRGTSLLAALDVGWYGQPHAVAGAVHAGSRRGHREGWARYHQRLGAAPQPAATQQLPSCQEDDDRGVGEVGDWMMSPMEEGEQEAAEEAARPGGPQQAQSNAVPPHGCEAAPLASPTGRAASCARLEAEGGEAAQAAGELPALRAISAPAAPGSVVGASALGGLGGQCEQKQQHGLKRVAAIFALQPELELHLQQLQAEEACAPQAAASPAPPHVPAASGALGARVQLPFRPFHPASDSKLESVKAWADDWHHVHVVAEDLRIRRANGWHGVVLGDQYKPHQRTVGFEVRAAA